MNELWNELAGRAGVKLDESHHARLERFLELLLEANRTMNLTRITDPQAARIQHVGDALTLLPLLPVGPIRVADVGSGGGVPGIPLAVVRPDAQIVLIESTQKKARFLEHATRELQLNNVQVVSTRAEDAGRSDLRESCDIAVARAVATMDWLAEWCLPLVKKGGSVLAMKGPRVADELPPAARAIRLLGGGEPAVHPVDLPGGERHVIVQIRKVQKTDPRYPRPATSAKGKSLR